MFCARAGSILLPQANGVRQQIHEIEGPASILKHHASRARGLNRANQLPVVPHALALRGVDPSGESRPHHA